MEPTAWTKLLLVACALLSACKRSRSSTPHEEPGPSPSVISIGVALGSCDDVAVCARECDAGSADRCRKLAASYAFGKGVDQDETQAALLYSRSCDLRDPPACVFAGQMYEFARGVPKNDATAARFYERACDLAWTPGCYNLAIMYERGTGVPASREKAGDLYQVACTAGARQACDKAREMHAPAASPFLEGGLP
jgi:TPR repeat protein